MLRPSPNHGTQRLPNDDDDDDFTLSSYYFYLWNLFDFAKPLNAPASSASCKRANTDHVRVSTPMRRADWPVARSMQGRFK